MSKTSSKRTSNDAADWKHLLSVGALLGAIAVVLLLGALLRSDDDVTREPRRAVSSAAVTEPSAPPVEDRAPQRAPAAEASRTRDPLADRVVSDLERLGGEGWTRQLAAICEPDNVRRWLEAQGSREELYVLPVTIADRPCFRVCWGRWPTAAAAERAGLPATVARRAGGDGRVVDVAEITR